MKGEFTAIWTSMPKEEKRAFAALIHSSVPTVSQVAHGHRRPSAARAVRMTEELHRLGYRRVRRHWFRPDIFDKD